MAPPVIIMDGTTGLRGTLEGAAPPSIRFCGSLGGSALCFLVLECQGLLRTSKIQKQRMQAKFICVLDATAKSAVYRF
jgi:hypothetical protein